MTNPTRFATIIMRMFKTAPMAATCRYQLVLPYCNRYVYQSLDFCWLRNPTDFALRYHLAGNKFRQDEQADEPTPCQETEGKVMPQRDEGEDQ